MSYGLALVLSVLSGAISLTQEILLVSLYYYHTAGRPDAFAHVLGFFLIGIALGTYFLPRWTKHAFMPPLAILGILFVASGLLFYFLIVGTTGTPFFFPAILLTSFFSGSIFPLLPKFFIRNSEHAGPAVAGIYAANIFGSTAGPLLTGFILMNMFGLEQLVLYASVVSVAIGALLLLSWHAVVLCLLSATIMIMGHAYFFGGFLERINTWVKTDKFIHTYQGRSGIINIRSYEHGDILYGSGAYDGRYSTDPYTDSNSIRRCYAIPALHPQPSEILQIGLGSGSWSRAILYSGLVKKLTIVEINPGYVELLKHYPEEAEILNDPRATIRIDDGRRWLRRHPEDKFDFILLNATFHWRSNSTNLLSEEFFKLVKAHLNNGGVFYINTTDSKNIPATAAKTFKHVVKVQNFVAMSDAPFSMSRDEQRKNLASFNRLNNFVTEETINLIGEDVGESLRAQPDLQVITDDNMFTEFKRKGTQPD